MKEFWEERFSKEEFIYGKEPNAFFKSIIDGQKPGKVLLPADGEGRNGVYAASLGWDVYAFDQSEKAKEKALHFAKSKNVKINYTISDVQTFHADVKFDMVAIVFLHLPSELRQEFHHKAINMLKPNGTLLLECFNKKQIELSTGGPKVLDLLYTKEGLISDFKSLSEKTINEQQTNLSEGNHHVGMAEVIRVLGKK